MSQLFSSGGQSIRVSASASVLPMNIEDWVPLGLAGWSPCSPQDFSRVFSNITVQKHQFFQFTFKKSLWLQRGEWTQGQKAVDDEVIQTRAGANRTAKSAHRELWPPEVDFGEMLALGNRNRTVTNNQNSGVRLSGFKPWLEASWWTWFWSLSLLICIMGWTRVNCTYKHSKKSMRLFKCLEWWLDV